MIIATSADEVRAAVDGAVAFVPTMGALHAGHASLIRLAAGYGGPVVVSDFVNPTQFGPHEDFERYPRDLEADAAIAAAAGADVLYAPELAEVYPEGFATTVDPGPLAADLCGRSRPGHFAGVATVVVRLYGLVRPTRAVFGRKDYQQLVLMQRVARDLALGVEVVPAATVREVDGLALSSRNRYLTGPERERAACIPGALRAAAEAFADGERDAAALLGAPDLDGLDLEYLELRADDLGSHDPERPAVLLIACRVGATRLIDNVLLDPAHPDRAALELAAKEPA
ncbi:MAG: pantoate--beta-alanine ligase [Actinomycetota bacterium]